MLNRTRRPSSPRSGPGPGPVLLCFLLPYFLPCTAIQNITIGALLTDEVSGVQFGSMLEALQKAGKDMENKNYNYVIRPYRINANDTELNIENMLCSMIREKIVALVSATALPQHSRFIVDMARSLNLLHVVAATHMINLHQAQIYQDSQFFPLVYADFDCTGLNKLLSNYTDSENFKWKRTMIVYESSYGLDVLNDFIEHSRSAKRRVTTVKLPSYKPETGLDASWNEKVDERVFRYALNLQEHYFIIHASFPCAEAVLNRAIAWKMTRSSFFYLITTPITYKEEQELLMKFTDRPNILYVHRFWSNSAPFFARTMTTNARFLFELIANYSNIVGQANVWPTWPLKLAQLSHHCKVSAELRSEISRPGRRNYSDIVTAIGWNTSEQASDELGSGNYFQQAYLDSRYGPDIHEMSVVLVEAHSENYTHKTLYPCEQCSANKLKSGVVRVAAYLDEPCIMLRKNSDDSERPFEGLCVEILEAVAKHLKVELLWSFVHDNLTGRYDDDLGWNGVIKMLIDRNADISGNLIEIDSKRAELLEFSEPVMLTTFEALVSQPSIAVPNIMEFLSPFTPTLWGGVLGAIMFSSLCFWAISQLLNWTQSDDCCAMLRKPRSVSVPMSVSVGVGEASALSRLLRGTKRCEKFTYNQCLWHTISAFFQQDSGTEPRSLSSKLLSTFIAVFTVIIVACYTANLTAFLAIERRNPAIRSIDELADTNIPLRILDSSALGAFLKRSKSLKTYGKIWDAVKGYPNEAGFVQSTAQGVALAKSGEAAWIGDSRSIRYWLAKRPCAKENSMTIIGRPFGAHASAFAFPRHSEIRENFSSTILEIIESDRWSRHLDESFSPQQPECSMEDTLLRQVSQRPSERMAIEAALGVTTLVCTGIGLALLLTWVKTVRLLLLRRNLKNQIQQQQQQQQRQQTQTQTQTQKRLCAVNEANESANAFTAEN